MQRDAVDVKILRFECHVLTLPFSNKNGRLRRPFVMSIVTALFRAGDFHPVAVLDHGDNYIIRAFVVVS